MVQLVQLAVRCVSRALELMTELTGGGRAAQLLVTVSIPYKVQAFLQLLECATGGDRAAQLLLATVSCQGPAPGLTAPLAGVWAGAAGRVRCKGQRDRLPRCDAAQRSRADMGRGTADGRCALDMPARSVSCTHLICP